MGGCYHQDERDRICDGVVGCGAVILILLILVIVVSATGCTACATSEPVLSGSVVGGTDDMVDVLTHDAETGVVIRHYGQAMADGSVRWYAAETVLGPDGLPVCIEDEVGPSARSDGLTGV